MKNSLLVLFFVLNISLVAQRTIVTTHLHSSDIALSQRFFQTPFSESISAISPLRPSQAPYCISLQHTSTGKWESKGRMYTISTAAYHFIIPKRVRLYDSINANFTSIGAQLTGFGFDLLYNQDKADILLMANLEGGLSWLYGDQRILSRNEYLMPKVTVMPRFGIGKLVLACFAEYGFDVTSKRWKRTLLGPKTGLPLGSFRQSMFSLGFSVGINYE